MSEEKKFLTKEERLANFLADPEKVQAAEDRKQQAIETHKKTQLEKQRFRERMKEGNKRILENKKIVTATIQGWNRTNFSMYLALEPLEGTDGLSWMYSVAYQNPKDTYSHKVRRGVLGWRLLSNPGYIFLKEGTSYTKDGLLSTHTLRRLLQSIIIDQYIISTTKNFSGPTIVKKLLQESLFSIGLSVVRISSNAEDDILGF